MDDGAHTKHCAPRPIQAATCPPCSSHRAAQANSPPVTFLQFPRQFHHETAPHRYDSCGTYPRIWFFKPNCSLGVFSMTWTRCFPCRCVQVRITACWWHSWEWTSFPVLGQCATVSLSSPQILTHPFSHQEASSSQNNVGHTIKTGLPTCSASLSCLGEEAAYWFGDSIQADP